VVCFANSRPEPSPILPFKESCIESLVSALIGITYAPVRVMAVNGLYQLVSSTNILNASEVDILMGHLNLLATKMEEEVSDQALKHLETLAKDSPSLLIDSSVEGFFKNCRGSEFI
jgi:hypothetical protein